MRKKPLICMDSVYTNSENALASHTTRCVTPVWRASKVQPQGRPDKMPKIRRKGPERIGFIQINGINRHNTDRLMELFAFLYCFLYVNGLIVLAMLMIATPPTEPDTQMPR